MAKSARGIPLLLGGNYEHVMGEAEIIDEGDELTITIRSTGNDANDVRAILSSGEIVALSFTGIPVTRRSAT